MRLPSNLDRTPKIIRPDRASCSDLEPGKVGKRKCCKCKTRTVEGVEDQCKICLEKLRTKFDNDKSLVEDKKYRRS